MIVSKYDAQGKYLSVGSRTIIPEGMEMPPLPVETNTNVFGEFHGRVDLHRQYHDLVTNLPMDMGDRPSLSHQFNYQSKQWEDPRTLTDMQALKWTEIKQSRDAVEFGTFTYNGMVFDGDIDAQRRLSGYISISKGAIAAGEPFSAVFTLADNTEVLLTAQDFVGIELAKVTTVATAFAKAANLRTQIDTATTVVQLESIHWKASIGPN